MDSVIVWMAAEQQDLFERRLDALAERSGDVSWALERGEERAYVGRDAQIVDELEAEELAHVLASVAAPIFYAVDFERVETCREILLAVADDPGVWIDTSHGLSERGSDFAARLRADASWDWRVPLS